MIRYKTTSKISEEKEEDDNLVATNLDAHYPLTLRDPNIKIRMCKNAENKVGYSRVSLGLWGGGGEEGKQ